MYKIYWGFLLLFICTLPLSAQDRLITTTKDTINCKVIKQDGQFILFKFIRDGKLSKVQYPAEHVISLDKGFYEQPDPLLEQYTVKRMFRLAVNGGRGYRLGKAIDIPGVQENDYIENLRWGGILEADVYYYPRKPHEIGFGLDYKLFLKSKTQTLSGNPVKDNIRIMFIGPSISFRTPLRNKHNTFLCHLSYGYSHYRDKGEAFGIEGKITGGAFGMAVSLGYDIGLSDKTALGIKLSAHLASVGKMHFESGGVRQSIKLDKFERENISSINLTLGLCLFP